MIRDVADETGLHENDVLTKIGEIILGEKPGNVKDSKAYDKCSKDKFIEVLKV